MLDDEAGEAAFADESDSDKRQVNDLLDPGEKTTPVALFFPIISDVAFSSPLFLPVVPPFFRTFSSPLMFPFLSLLTHSPSPSI